MSTSELEISTSFVFTPEQDQLRSSVRRFLDQNSPESEVRRLAETTEGYDAAVWRQMGELGLVSLAIPEDYGGAGGSYVDVGLVLEEMGRTLACAPYLASAVLAAETLLQGGDEASKRTYLPKIAGAEIVATLALADHSWDLDDVTTVARADGSHWTLHGTKAFVLDGATADLILVAAHTNAGLSLFAVEASGAQLTRTALTTLDRTRKMARLEFDATPARLVGQEGSAREPLERALSLAAIGLAAEQVGGAQRCLDMSVEYAKTRIQFGRAIGSFQAIKHKCADMLIAVEAARSAAYHGLWTAKDTDELHISASAAKAYCSEAYFKVAADNIQIHGGIGFTWEHPAHLYFRRAKTSQALFGDPTFHKRQLARRAGIIQPRPSALSAPGTP